MMLHAKPRQISSSKYQPSQDLSSEDEDEQERLLSEQYGEATEMNTEKKRKNTETETDQDLEKDFANDASIKKQRVSRPKFEPSTLIGPQGLIKIKNEFPTIMKHQTKRLHRQKNTMGRTIAFQYDSEERYAKSLLSTYTNVFFDLYPHMAFQDLLLRVEKFGSKKEVKDYVKMMREDERRLHVEKVYGMEKADRMLKDLENFQQLDTNVFASENDNVDLYREDYKHRTQEENTKKNNNDLDEGETEAVFDDEKPVEETSESNNEVNSHDKAEELKEKNDTSKESTSASEDDVLNNEKVDTEEKNAGLPDGNQQDTNSNIPDKSENDTVNSGGKGNSTEK